MLHSPTVKIDVLIKLCLKISNQVGGVSQIFQGFPSRIMPRVAAPKDKVLNLTATGTLVENGFNLEFGIVRCAENDRQRRRTVTFREGFRGQNVTFQEGDV